MDKERNDDVFPPHTREAWRKEVDRLLEGKPYEKAMTTETFEDLRLQPMYWPDDMGGLPQIGELPGCPDYVRAARFPKPRECPWLVAQETPCPTPGEFRDALLHDLGRGQNAIHAVVDEATRLCLDPDAAPRGSVGRGGLSLACLRDLEDALSGAPIDRMPIEIEAFGAALPVAAMSFALARRRGFSPDSISGCVGSDPLTEFALHGELPASLESAWKEMVELTKWAAAHAPRLQTIAVHGSAYAEAGANAVQELAFAFATAVEYLRRMAENGLCVDTAAPRIRFHLALGSNFFLEIAKLRAARWVWSRIVEAFGGNEEARKMYVHARTSRYAQTEYDPYVNMLRTTTQAFSGIAGGCDSLHVGFFDEIRRTPDEFSRRVARNQQILLREEAHLDRVVDPAGGSWYVESLTAALAEKVWALFQEVEGKGGMARALEAGFPQSETGRVAQIRRKDVQKRKEVVVGVNMYADASERPLDRRFPDYSELQKRRGEEISRLRKVGTFAPEGGSLVDSLIRAFEAGATLGQAAALLGRTGEGPKIASLLPCRAAEPFERLRNRVEEHRARTGRRPAVFLANMGSAAEHRTRADFCRGFLEAGGFQVLDNNGFASPQEAVDAAVASQADAVVVCSTDERYPALVPPIAEGIKRRTPRTHVILAGFPTEQVEAHRRSGIEDFLHIRVDACEWLSQWLERTGVSA